MESTTLLDTDIQGSSILSSAFDAERISDELSSFQGCCESCQIKIDTIEETKLTKFENVDSYALIKTQYKTALDRAINGIEVACSEHCVCKTTDVDRFKDETPSFATLYNLAELLEISDGMTVVDFGCGTGHDLFELNKKHSGLNLIGVDVTDSMIAFAQEMNDKIGGKNFSFIVGRDFREVEDESVDLVYLNNVFNIILDKSKFLKDAFQVLKAGGKLIIADEFTEEAIPDKLKNDPEFQCGGIAGALSVHSLRQMSKSAGFSNLKTSKVRDYQISYEGIDYNFQTGVVSIYKMNKIH